MKNLVLTEQVLRDLENAIKDYMIETNVRAVFIIKTSGQIVYKTGISKGEHFIQSIGALIAGIFNATSSLAQLIGDEYFNNIFQEGAHISLFFSAIDSETMIVSFYDKRSIIGVIQILTEQLKDKILQFMETEEPVGKNIFNDEYKEEVENLLNNMFK